MRFKIIYLGLLSFFFSFYVQSQTKNSAWVDMFSYLKIKHLQPVGSKIYAQSDNAFFVYDTDSGEIVKISSLNGLTGDNISNFYYHQDLHKLFIFHEGGLIEVVDAQKKVFRSPELAYNQFIPIEQKEVNRITAKGDRLYLATKYGISIYNLNRNEFGDTYYFTGPSGNLEVKSVAFFNHKIFAATVKGLYFADENANLINQSVWTKIDIYHWNDLIVFNQKLLGVKDKVIYRVTTQSISPLLSFNNYIRKLHANDYLSVVFDHEVKVYNQNLILQHNFNDMPFTSERFFDATDLDNQIYIATKKHGVLQTPLQQQQYTDLHPDSPLSNHAFAIDARDGILWLAYGAHFEFVPRTYKEGLSSYQNNKWINIPYEDFNMSEVCAVKINPINSQEVYFVSIKRGLLRVRNNQIDKKFDQNNSPLQEFVPYDIRVFTIDFDSQNNLWVTQLMQPSLLKLKPDDTWETVSLNSILSNPNQDYHGFSDMKIDTEDNVWFGTDPTLLGYNPKTQTLISDKEGLQESAYPIVQTIEIDKDNIMWVGSREGLRILPDPQQIFDNNSVEFKPIKIVYEDAVQLLMEGQNITKIRVDGSNNKWITTLGSGVYYFSEDGTHTIYHFTKDNSPLPSNDVYDVAIDGSTGMVYFASIQGLIGYKGFATDSSDNMDDVYAFPNPANEKQHDFVTIRGLIEGVNVKIVDIEGNLVYETTSKGGSIQWDLTAFGKYKVASGVYIALITNDDGSKIQTTKILVIK